MVSSRQRTLHHIFLSAHGVREDFTSPRSGGSEARLPDRDRSAHADMLSRALAAAVRTAEVQITQRDPEIAGGTEGFYLEFDLPTAQQNLLDKLENRRGQEPIELVAVRPSADEGQISATVFVPISKKDNYRRKVEAYREENTGRGRPRNEPLVASIDTVRLAQARSLFTDDLASFPLSGQQKWWEVWLRIGKRPILERAASHLNMVLREHTVRFAEREVVLALASPEALDRLIQHTDAVAELRLSQDTPREFMEISPDGQRDWSDDLLRRVTPPDIDAPAVCLLDSGTTSNHPLIRLALDAVDQQAWDASWSAEDSSPRWFGHGTQMSGLVLYGDLTPLLSGSDSLVMTHRLESVKILPDRGTNTPDLYGHITASAIACAEIQSPQRPRVYCLAVTAEGDHWPGRPSSWSAKVDDLAYGEGRDQRFLVISAGNIREFYRADEYPAQNETAAIESPAQAWNALTVGAITERCIITDPNLSGWDVMAPAGDLSPLSRTSVLFSREWPIKPDVVFEGGNQGINPATGVGDPIDDLALLTTFYRPTERLFTVTGDTSAATALVSRIGAQILAEHPNLWPETVRALIVHSAGWTPQMRLHLPERARQSDKENFVRRYGYGVPDLDRALRSAQNDVTLIVQEEMQPFQADGSDTRSRDMVLHDFPWPIGDLEALGDAFVSLRVTLSYFIEPNPGERGWTRRHRYASHGLRFAVKRAEESLDDFRQRINRAARDEEDHSVAGGSESGWFLGSHLRDKGSIHSDIWQGTAVDLASRHAIAVYPTIGWWREKPTLRRCDRQVRYALVVSLQANVDVNLYTSIQTLIASSITIMT